jgi:hypothetical protein
MSLHSTMDFDHVIEVMADGGIVHRSDLHAPEVSDDGGGQVFISPDSWSLLDGYSGQQGYSGPVMHSSEFIGGSMERDILAEPGVYVAVVVYDSTSQAEEGISGWAVAKQDA